MRNKQEKHHIKESELSNLQMRIDLFKESNKKLTTDLELKNNKINHLVRENVLMKTTLEQFRDSENTSKEIKKICTDILENVDKYKKPTQNDL